MYGCESWTIKKAEELGEDSWESLGLQEDPTSPVLEVWDYKLHDYKCQLYKP